MASTITYPNCTQCCPPCAFACQGCAFCTHVMPCAWKITIGGTLVDGGHGGSCPPCNNTFILPMSPGGCGAPCYCYAFVGSGTDPTITLDNAAGLVIAPHGCGAALGASYSTPAFQCCAATTWNLNTPGTCCTGWPATITATPLDATNTAITNGICPCT